MGPGGPGLCGAARMTRDHGRVRFFHVDAFTTSRFGGNPAVVMPMDELPGDATLGALAAENNLSETAFLTPDSGEYRIRWFTPTTEVPLCGHATLASAAAVMERLEPGRTAVVFRSASGPLTVRRNGDAYVMDFPARPAAPASLSERVSRALGAAPQALYENSFNFMAVYPSERDVRGLTPDPSAVARLERPGVVVTAPGSAPYDFVSRYFAPAKGIPEDPVTGAAHCMLAPYWAARLGRPRLRAFQASARGGEVGCEVEQDRVLLRGSCVFYAEGFAEY